MTTETTGQLLCSCCGGASSPPQHFCATCEHILPMPDRVSYFEFMELPIQLSLDARLLQQTFYRLSRQFHPDYYQNRPGPEQKAALERSAALNRAYDTLQDTVKRVEYYMKLVGFVSEGKKNQVPPDLMMEILDLQEKLDDQQSASPEQKLARPGNRCRDCRHEGKTRRSIRETGRSVCPARPGGSRGQSRISPAAA
ncbi:MAG: Fe-S protein assembly co-chaperone HscB [Candidatus Omnitrophica bacterium]|nr:Fe-S protein assembly co-chaperone HscB [Candidatus Omnitrophota bacterium]